MKVVISLGGVYFGIGDDDDDEDGGGCGGGVNSHNWATGCAFAYVCVCV